MSQANKYNTTGSSIGPGVRTNHHQMSSLTSLLYKGDKAFSLLNDPDFQNACRELAQLSTGFTRLQEVDYLIIWYTTYRAVFEPVLLISYNEKNELVGFMGLGWHKKEDYLIHAGNAEYHSWLARGEFSIPFLRDAFSLIKKEWNLQKWAWNFMPFGLHFSILQAALSDGMSLHVDTQDSLIWDLTDPIKLQHLLKHRRLRTKRNGLKKRGELRFEVIHDPKRLRTMIDTVRTQSDFRQEAVNNYRPFAKNPQMGDFYVNALQRPNTFHVSALWLDEQLLACHIGIEDGERVCLGLICHDPTENKYSPGMLLIIDLANNLTENGYKVLDMTPGKDSYKAQFSNNYQSLFRPNIYFSKKRFWKDRLKRLMALYTIKILHLLKVDVTTRRRWKTNLLEWKINLEQVPLSMIFSSLRKIVWKKDTFFLYELDIKNEKSLAGGTHALHRQDFTALLNYEDTQPFLTRRKLLQDALNKFSKREVLFSQSQSGQLLWLCWLKVTNGPLSVWGYDGMIELEAGSKILYDHYTAPTADPYAFNQNISEVIWHLKEAGETRIWIGLNGNNKMSQQKIEHLRVISCQKYTTIRILHFIKKSRKSSIIIG